MLETVKENIVIKPARLRFSMVCLDTSELNGRFKL